MIELTSELKAQILKVGWPPELVDPKTGETFVLIHKEMFERVRAVLEREDGIAEVEEMYPLTAEVLGSEDATSRESA